MRSPVGQDAQQDYPPGPPKPPGGNPWDWQTKPGEARTVSDAASQYRRDTDDESPVLPSASLNGDGMRFAVVHPPPPSVAGGPRPDHSDIEVDNRRASTASGHSVNSNHYSRPHRKGTISSFSIPENEVSSQPGVIPFFQPSNMPNSPASQYSTQASVPMSDPASQHSRQVSIPVSDRSDTSEALRPELISLPSHDSRLPRPRASSAVSPLNASSLPPSYPELAPEQPSAAMLAEMDCAPIPVVTEEVSESTKPPPASVEGCKIDDTSSFTLSKGFCEGAKEVLRGGIGVKRTKKPVAVCRLTVSNCRTNIVLGICYSSHSCKMSGLPV